MQELNMVEVDEVGGGAQLGKVLGMVVGGLVCGLLCMAATAATGGAAATALGIVGTGMRTGGEIGSAIQDGL